MSAPPTDAELLDAFAPVLAKVGEGVVERDATRAVPVEQCRLLLDAGYGTLRVPHTLGGLGASLRQVMLLQATLAAADPNLAQVFRIHFKFSADQWQVRHTPQGRRWLERVAAGALFANATKEHRLRGGAAPTSLVETGGRLLLNGAKSYSTGSLLADHVIVAVAQGGRKLQVIVPREAPGVEVLDDFPGFGQRGSASGTTVFTDVEVDPDDVVEQSQPWQSLGGQRQLNHLATIAGIVRRAVDDLAGYARTRTHSYPWALSDLPRADPQVQQVVGHTDAVAYVVLATTLAAADTLGAAHQARYELNAAPDHERTADADARVRELELAAEVDILRAQSVVVDLGLDAVTRVFDVGGASALDQRLALDRHWRNLRTLASHNPAMFRARQLGDLLLNGTPPALVG